MAELSDFVNIKLPRNTIEKVRKIVQENKDLFENETEYITHCIINYNRSLKF